MRQTLDTISTKVLRIIPLFLSFFIPLFFLPITADYFTFNKFYLITVIATISLTAWCIRSLARSQVQFTSSPALIPLLFLVLINILSSTLLSQTPHISLFGQTALFSSLTIIFITVTSSQKNRFAIKSAVIGLIGSATILSLFTLSHYFGLTKLLFPDSDTFANRFFNLTGSLLPALTFTFPILIATITYALQIKKWLQKSVVFVCALLMIAASVVNLSLILPPQGQAQISLLPYNVGWSVAVDTLKTWKTALLGTGPESFFTTFSRLRPAFLNLDKNLWSLRFSESSNYFFTLLTTTGILGSLAFIFSFLRPLFTAIHLIKNNSSHNDLAFIFSGLTVILISFFVLPTGLISITTAFILLICLTLELKLAENKSVTDLTLNLSPKPEKTHSYQDLSKSTPTTFSRSFIPWFVTFMVTALLTTFWFFASKIYLGSVIYKQAVTMSQTDPYNAFVKFQKAATTDNHNPYYPQKLSQIYLAIANVYFTKESPTTEDKKIGTDFAQRALDAAKQSVKLDPQNVTAWENLFTIYKTLIPYAQGSADMAISHGLQVATLEPTNPAIYLQLGSLLYSLGDTDQAVRFIDRSRELKQNWDLPYFNLSSIYKTKGDYLKALQYAKLGLQYTNPDSTNLTSVQEEIKNLEGLVLLNSKATPSAALP